MAEYPSPSVWNRARHYDGCGKNIFTVKCEAGVGEGAGLQEFYSWLKIIIYIPYILYTHTWVHNIFWPKDAVILVTFLEKILLKVVKYFFFYVFCLLYSSFFGGIIVPKSENHQSASDRPSIKNFIETLTHILF